MHVVDLFLKRSKGHGGQCVGVGPSIALILGIEALSHAFYAKQTDLLRQIGIKGLQVQLLSCRKE